MVAAIMQGAAPEVLKHSLLQLRLSDVLRPAYLELRGSRLWISEQGGRRLRQAGVARARVSVCRSTLQVCPHPRNPYISYNSGWYFFELKDLNHRAVQGTMP